MKKNALLFGMSLDEFWYGNPQDFYIYADCYNDKQEQAAFLDDVQAWRIGIYVVSAIRQAQKGGSVYPKKPCDYDKYMRRKADEGKTLKERILASAARHNANFRLKHGRDKDNG